MIFNNKKLLMEILISAVCKNIFSVSAFLSFRFKRLVWTVICANNIGQEEILYVREFFQRI